MIDYCPEVFVHIESLIIWYREKKIWYSLPPENIMNARFKFCTKIQGILNPQPSPFSLIFGRKY
jgi:hypothetical protein